LLADGIGMDGKHRLQSGRAGISQLSYGRGGFLAVFRNSLSGEWFEWVLGFDDDCKGE
jgi:hypothetical protein